MFLKPIHMSAPRLAMIRTAIAAETTPSPDSSLTARAASTRSHTYARRNVSSNTVTPPSSRHREEAQGLDERDGHEDHARQQGGDRDRDPDLLAPALDRLDQPAMKVAADRPRFLGYQSTEVARLATQREHGYEAVEGVDSSNVGPLA